MNRKKILCVIRGMPKKLRRAAVMYKVKKIKKQAFGFEEGEVKGHPGLMWAIFERAVLDAIKPCKRKTGEPYETTKVADAKAYLRSSMPHLEAIGINPVWAREQLVSAGLEL